MGEARATALQDLGGGVHLPRLRLPRVRPVAASWRRAALPGLGVALLVLTVLKGLLTFPHDWVVGHFLLNYSEGFVKRGLVGTLLRPLLAGRPAPEVRAVVGGVALAGLLALLALLAREVVRLLAPGRARAGLDAAAALCLACSPALWHLGLALGYFESLVLLLGLLATPGGRLPLPRFVPLALLALLVHEMAALLLVPLLLLHPLTPQAGGAGLSRARAGVVLALLAGFVLVAWCVFHSPPPPALREQMLAAGAATPYWADAVHARLNDPFVGNLQRILHWPRIGNVWASGLLVYTPAAWALLALGLVRLWRAPLSRRARLGWSVAYAAASLASLAMVLIAYDFTRLFSLSTLQAFLAYRVLVARLGPVEPRREGALLRTPAAPRTRPGRVALGGLVALAVVSGLLMPARFTFMSPQPRYVPAAFDRPWVDPWGRLVGRLLPTG
jgi:hypothetical protein